MKINERQSAYPTRLFILALILAIGAALFQAEETLSRAWVNSGYLQLNRAVVLNEGPHFERAAAIFGRIEPDSIVGQRSWRGLGLTYWFQSRLDEAIAVWERVDHIESEFRPWARQAERANDIIGVRNWNWAAVQMDPGSGDNWYRLALSSDQAGSADAREYYLRALASSERAEFGRSNILTRLGELQKREEPPDWAAVLARFDEAIQQNEFVDEADIIASRMGRAEALERLGQLQASLDEYLSVVQLEPELYWANVHGGRLTWYLERDAETAIAYLEKAIDIDGKPKWAYVSLGLVYAGSGRPEQAISFFEKALAIDPEDGVSQEQIHLLTSGNDS